MLKLGIPNISSNIYCVNEIITHNVNGLLFDYKDYHNIILENKKNYKHIK